MKSQWFLYVLLTLAFALANGSVSHASKCEAYNDVLYEWEGEAKTLAGRQVRVLDEQAERYLEQTKIYVSLTTSPQRIQMLEYVIEPMDLSHVEKIYISIPKKFGRTGESYVIPDYVKNHPKIEILETETDEGPVMKLLIAAEHLKAKNENAAIITVDDDSGYPRGMINEMITVLSRYPNAVAANIGGIGETLMTQSPWAKKLSADIKSKNKIKSQIPGLKKSISVELTNFIEGWAGIAYPLSAVDTNRLRAYSKLNSEAFVSDDLVISAMLAVTGVPRIKIASTYANGIHQYTYGRLNALFNGAGMPESVFQSFREDDPNANSLIYSEASGEYELYKYKTTLDAIEAYEKKKAEVAN